MPVRISEFRMVMPVTISVLFYYVSYVVSSISDFCVVLLCVCAF